MTRIGFAYNQKPDTGAPQAPLHLADDAPQREEEPPGSRRDSASRNSPLPASDEHAEWDTAETIDAVAHALSALGPVIRLEATEDFPERLRAERPDIVFNIAEGLHGVNREAHVPAICEFFNIPYSGSDPFTLSLCLDKARTKETLAFHGVSTAPFMLVRSLADLPALRRRVTRGGHNGPAAGHSRADSSTSRSREQQLRLPLFVKPVHEGSSKGITEQNYCETVESLEARVASLLESYAQPVLVEEFLPGAEFTCALLGNGANTRVLPLVGMNFGSLPAGALPIYGFEAKWIWDSTANPLEIFECPARIDDSLRTRIESLVLQTWRVLGCRDWSRIDVRLDAEGTPHIVEINPLPGILPDPADNSCFPKAARAAGITYDELIQQCAISAAERYGISLRADRATPPVARAAAG
jgi:D-alanine-D-alanine ligase